MPKNSPELIIARGIPKNIFENLYYNEGMSHRLISEKFEVSKTAIDNIFRKLGIKNRTIAESQTCSNLLKVKELTFLQEQLLLFKNKSKGK